LSFSFPFTLEVFLPPRRKEFAGAASESHAARLIITVHASSPQPLPSLFHYACCLFPTRAESEVDEFQVGFFRALCSLDFPEETCGIPRRAYLTWSELKNDYPAQLPYSAGSLMSRLILPAASRPWMADLREACANVGPFPPVFFSRSSVFVSSCLRLAAMSHLKSS